MTAKQLLHEGKQALKGIIDEYEIDAGYLFESATGMTKAQLLTYPETEISGEVCHSYRLMLEKRSKHVPLQYIIGNREFMGMEFEVNEHVLIPRQDTEILVEEALKLLKKGNSVLDMCTGSGCIIVSLAKLSSLERAVGADISENALKVAKKNSQRLGAEVCFIESDLFSNIGNEQFDMIVSNPPYIETSLIEGLMPEVRDFEPRIALDGGIKGLDYYERIIKDAGKYLKDNGYLIFEIGYNQGDSVSTLLKEEGYSEVSVINDLAGLPRVCAGRLVRRR